MKTLTFLARPFLSPKYRAAPDIVAMCLYFMAGLADGAMMPFFALWAQQEAHIPIRFIGLLLACYAGGELLATPLLGGIADRVGRRPVLLCSSLGVGCGFLLLAHMHQVIAIGLCLVGIGVFECALHPTIATVIADVVPAERLRMRYAAARIASNLGHIVGPALGAVLALISLSAVFAGCGLSLLCAGMLVVAVLPETWLKNDQRDGSVPAEEEEEGLATLLPAFRDRRMAALLLWFTIIEIVGGWTEVVIPVYAHGAHALSTSQIGLLFTYAAAVGTLVQWPITKWSGNVPAFPLILGAGALLAGSFGLLLIEPGALTLGASLTLLAFAQALWGPLVPATVNALAPPSARASYLAAISTANDLKDSIGPASGMFLYGLSERLPWMLGLPVALLASWALAVSIKRSEMAQSDVMPKSDTEQLSKPPLYVRFR
ncbi:MFS transporter [Dyella acidiphila]|uniref:MFS transporter n=1 Tax=Dyella acidiphila TaxID=2775866 RepID=A0ABR9GA27_9GAMM|nr:MFS transporter [Dyella acidiphila]MBE1160897.1 MFS transporter [Dyella acidiphila]